jgi:hypothetical protein
MEAAAGSGGSSRTAAVLKAIKAEAAAAAEQRGCGKRRRQEQQQQVAGGSDAPLGRAAARLLHDHLHARLLPGLPNEDQLQYYRLADEPFSAAQLVQLHSRHLAPKTVRIVQADSTSGAGSSRDTRRATKSSRAEQQYPLLAPGLLRLRDAVYVFKHTTSTAAIPASAVPQDAASRKLLLALHCLQEWEGRMVQQQEPPMLLQLLLLGKLQDGGGEGEVVEVVDLAAEDDMAQEQQQQQQLFAESGADCMVVCVKQGQAARRGAAAAAAESGRVQAEAFDGASAAIKRESEG